MATRAHQPMPLDILEDLEKRELLETYAERPHYQRNDYLGWISRAKRPETRRKRIDQMLDELTVGGVYMGMEHNPSARRAKS